VDIQLSADQLIYDVAIIGAGPSGCACALSLYGKGLRVVVIDKENYPRDKICGDAIPGPSFKAMRQINLIWADKLKEFIDVERITRSSIFAPNGKTITLDWVLYTYNSKRTSFDNFLMELVKNETDTEVIQNNRLKQVQITDEFVSATLINGSVITARIIIGADGANSVVRRQLMPNEKDPIRNAAAVRAYYSGITDIVSGVNEFHFFNELLPGYFWMFPLPNGEVNVGFGISQAKNEKDPKKLRESLSDIITNYPSIAARFQNAEQLTDFKGFGLPFWNGNKPISGTRFMLCGDAASLIDPLQGHGIDKAIWSGYYAAKQAISAITSNNYTAHYLADYDKALYKRISPELAKTAFIINLLIKFPKLMNLFTLIGQNQNRIQWIARKLKI